MTPINAGGASGCPSSFTTQIFTSPHSLDDAEFEIESSDMWDLRLRWDFPSDGGYRHPILVGLLLVGSDNVIYASKLVYFTRDPTGSNLNFQTSKGGVLQTKDILLPTLCESILGSTSLTPTT